jgi:hypothetical protein
MSQGDQWIANPPSQLEDRPWLKKDNLELTASGSLRNNEYRRFSSIRTRQAFFLSRAP